MSIVNAKGLRAPFIIIGLLALLTTGPVSALPILATGNVNAGVGDTFDVGFGFLPPGTGGMDPIMDLAFLQVDLMYDSSVVALNDVTQGSIDLPPGRIDVTGTLFPSFGLIDDLTYDATQTTGVNGFGSLLLFNFTALAVGHFTFEISDVTMIDTSGNDIAFGLRNGVVSVDEPPTLMLLVVGLMGGLLVATYSASKRLPEIHEVR